MRTLSTVVPLLLMVVLGIGIPEPLHAQESIRVRPVARVLASGGIGGRFARPRCVDGDTLVATSTAVYTYALMREARRDDRPMVVDTGGLLAPHGVARFAAEHDPEAMAEMVDALGYRALALGADELTIDRDALVAVAQRLRAAGIPIIASNLHCGPEAAALCEQIVDASDGPSVHRVAQERMAVLSFLPANSADLLPPESRAGLTFDAPADAMPAAVRVARGRARIVIAVLAMEPGEALTLAQALPEDARPDLLLLAGANDLLFARPASFVPALAAPPHGDSVEVEFREGTLRMDAFEMLAQPVGMRGIAAGAPVHDFIDRIGRRYCGEWGRVLPGGRLERALDARGMTSLVARLIREEAGADVSVLDHNAIFRQWRPAREDSLTESDVYVALPYDEGLVVADVPPSWLDLVARRTGADATLVTPGMELSGTSARVRGRATQAAATYRVVTVSFLAEGGERGLPPLPEGVVWRPLEDGLRLRGAVLRRLSERRAVDVRDSLEDPNEAPEWVFSANVDGTFSGSSISNQAMYSPAQLNRVETLTLGLDVDLRADATAPLWSWETRGIARYRTQWTERSETSGGAFAEAVDLLQLRSTGAWRGLRESASQWYVPDPYAEVFVESEFNAPASRDWHWFLFRPTIGLRFPLLPQLELKINGGMQYQFFEPGAEVEAGLGSVLTLTRFELLRLDRRTVTIDGLFDFFMADVGDENRVQLRGQLNAAIDLAGPLALTFGMRLFVQQEQGREVGFALDGTAGLRLGWLGRTM